MTDSYVALDLETTGIGAKKEKITEIGMVKVLDGQIVSTYHSLVNPRRPIPEEIVRLTGIDDSMVQDAPGMEEILGEILDVHTTENQETGEELYIMKLDVNELEFDVCVPVRDVFGEPAKGRRLKADIWLQGRINF